MKVYLYTESMKDEDSVPIEGPLKSYEANNIDEAIAACPAGSQGPDLFNNHARAKSVRNAFLLMDMLLISTSQWKSSCKISSRWGSSSRVETLDSSPL